MSTAPPERAIYVPPAAWPGGPWLVGILASMILFVVMFLLGLLLG